MALNRNKTAETASEIRIGGQLIGWARKAARKPSISPAIGFSARTQSHFFGTRDEGYITGVAYIQICVMNGTTYRKSRYDTVSADSRVPTPAVARIVATRNTGTRNSCPVIGVP